MNVWATSPLGIVVRHIICGFYLFIFFLPVILPSEIPKLPTDPPVREFPLLRLPPQDGYLYLTLLSLFLSFIKDIFCPTSFQRQWAAFLGAWCPLPAFRSCLVVFAQSFGKGNDNLLQYCCLENPMDRRAWRATVHGVEKSQTQLSDFTFHFCSVSGPGSALG